VRTSLEEAQACQLRTPLTCLSQAQKIGLGGDRGRRLPYYLKSMLTGLASAVI
jgi:hypothetical protein